MTKILLVEDDKSLREIYGVRLLAEGYDIVSAGDGEEALAMAIKEAPNLIISDVMMPKISGFDMLDILRSTSATRGIKIIVMTALSSEEQRKRGEELGADRFLVKSQVGIEDVVKAVHEVLGDADMTVEQRTADKSSPFTQTQQNTLTNQEVKQNTPQVPPATQRVQELPPQPPRMVQQPEASVQHTQIRQTPPMQQSTAERRAFSVPPVQERAPQPHFTQPVRPIVTAQQPNVERVSIPTPPQPVLNTPQPQQPMASIQPVRPVYNTQPVRPVQSVAQPVPAPAQPQPVVQAPQQGAQNYQQPVLNTPAPAPVQSAQPQGGERVIQPMKQTVDDDLEEMRFNQEMDDLLKEMGGATPRADIPAPQNQPPQFGA